MGLFCSRSDPPCSGLRSQSLPLKTPTLRCFVRRETRRSRLLVPLNLWPTKNDHLVRWSFCWCGRWDLNPYARAHAPQTCLSANSSTAAHHVSIAVGMVVVNPFWSNFYAHFLRFFPVQKGKKKPSHYAKNGWYPCRDTLSFKKQNTVFFFIQHIRAIIK